MGKKHQVYLHKIILLEVLILVSDGSNGAFWQYPGQVATVNRNRQLEI